MCNLGVKTLENFVINVFKNVCFSINTFCLFFESLEIHSILQKIHTFYTQVNVNKNNLLKGCFYTIYTPTITTNILNK